MEQSASDLVISYSRSDVQWVERFCEELKGQGLNTWADNRIEPGTDDWDAKIEQAIRETKFVVAVMSPDAYSSKWVRKELGFADNNQVKIIPVLAKGDESESIPLRLSNCDYVDARGSARDSSAETVCGIVAGIRAFSFDAKPGRSWIDKGTTTIKTVLKHPITVATISALLLAFVATAVFVDAELRSAIRKFEKAKREYWALAFDVMRENFFLEDIVDENGERKPNTPAYKEFTDEANENLLNSIESLHRELKDQGFKHTITSLKCKCRPIKKELMDPLWDAAPEKMTTSGVPSEADWQEFQKTPDFVRIRSEYFQYCDDVIDDACKCKWFDW